MQLKDAAQSGTGHRNAARGCDLRAARSSSAGCRIGAGARALGHRYVDVALQRIRRARPRREPDGSRAQRDARGEVPESHAGDRFADGRVAERCAAGQYRADFHEPVRQLAVHDRARGAGARYVVPRYAYRIDRELGNAADAPCSVVGRGEPVRRVRLHAHGRQRAARARLQQPQHDAVVRRSACERHDQPRRRQSRRVRADARARLDPSTNAATSRKTSRTGCSALPKC